MSLAEVRMGEAPSPAQSVDMSDIPQHLWHLLPMSGTVYEIWSPDLTAEGWEQVRLLLDDIERQR